MSDPKKAEEAKSEILRLTRVAVELSELQESLSKIRDRYRELLWEFESVIESFDEGDTDLGIARHYIESAVQRMSERV